MMRYEECAVASTTERISPRKLNLVAAEIRGLDSTVAMNNLDFFHQRSVPIIKKVIKSAVANASHNKGIESSTFIMRAEVGTKGKLKRYRPGSHGHPSRIRRPYAHLRIVLGVKEQQKEGQQSKQKERKDGS